MKYELQGDARALEYYYLNPETGVISLKKLLTQGSQVSDTVSEAETLTLRAIHPSVTTAWANSWVEG